MDINKHFKDTFGKLAYYIKGIEQLTGFKPIPMRITNSHGVIEEDINLFLVLNSSGTGGINKLVPNASVNDGVFDFLGFRNDLIKDTPMLLLNFLRGEYLEDKGVIYFKDSDIKIENLDPDNRFSLTDCDGEAGPEMPVEIKNIPKAIKVFIKE
jgi:diacylglycerol kinase family enzyme